MTFDQADCKITAQVWNLPEDLSDTVAKSAFTKSSISCCTSHEVSHLIRAIGLQVDVFEPAQWISILELNTEDGHTGKRGQSCWRYDSSSAPNP